MLGFEASFQAQHISALAICFTAYLKLLRTRHTILAMPVKYKNPLLTSNAMNTSGTNPLTTDKGIPIIVGKASNIKVGKAICSNIKEIAAAPFALPAFL